MNTNIVNGSDAESGDLFQGMTFLDFETVQKGVLGKDPFEGLKTNKSFKEISNEIALESPLREKSVFNEINPKDFKPTKIL